jgi:hypothetical protein
MRENLNGFKRKRPKKSPGGSPQWEPPFENELPILPVHSYCVGKVDMSFNSTPSDPKKTSPVTFSTPRAYPSL